MRVKISYSIDLEEVPTEIAKMLRSCTKEVNSVARGIDAALQALEEGNDTLKIVDGISRVREEMYRVDSNLQDVMSILTGYQQTLLDTHLAGGPEESNSFSGVEND